MYVIEATYYNIYDLQPKKRSYRTVFDSKKALEEHVKEKQKRTAHKYTFKVWPVDTSVTYEPNFVLKLALEKVL